MSGECGTCVWYDGDFRDMAEFLLECKCGKMQMYQKYIKGTPNKKHWFIVCKNCDAFVEARTKEKAIDLWNTWDFYHKNKIHTQ